jgi:4-aminobutyrate aminotransferase-like enzyme
VTQRLESQTAQAGPRTQQLLDRLRRVEGGGLRTFVEDPPLAWHRAQSCWIEDPDGKRYTDLYGGFAVATVGHAHPRVVEAIRRQAGELIHCPSAHPSEVRAEFLESLAAIAPHGLDRILPAITGAMANEVAVQLARSVRGGGEVVTFSGSYFGRTAGVVGLAGKAGYREVLGARAEGQFLPYPYPARMGSGSDSSVMKILEHLATPAGGLGKIAGVILEPIQGNAGVVIPPDSFLPALRRFCDSTGALLIFDEIQSGFGRTGRMWAADHTGVVPDLMTVGKGIGGGLAVAAVLGRDQYMRWPADAYTSTFLTNNLNLAAATAAIAVMRDEDLVTRSRELGDLILPILHHRLSQLAVVREVRGRGLWIAIEFWHPDGGPRPELAAAVVRLARERGVIVGRGGYEGAVVKISPPLVIQADELQRAVDAVAECVEEVNGREGL